jgi:DNA polymerase III alpha subunit
MDRIRHTCETRLQERYSASDRSWAARRLDRELKIIRERGQVGAFEEAASTAQLIRDRGDSCRLIGAGCCSLVAYLTDLSEIDPIQHGLPYERFLETGQGRTVHFVLVSTTPTITEREAALLKSEAVTVHPATALEAVPCLVARRVRRQHSGIGKNAATWDDPAAFALLRSGDIEGINQLDGTELKELLPALKPRSLMDIAAITAAYQGEVNQPGLIARYINRASGETARSPNWIVEETLQETRGMILFQEQIMLLLNRLADIPLADGYAFVRAVSKRNWEQIGTFAEWFMAEADKAALEEWDSGELFETIREAAAWAVCKSHHLAQAVTTYQAAYLKAHHPEEFNRALKLVHH